MSVSTEDFIKAIYKLKEDGQAALSSAVAKKLSVSNAAVTDMSRKLSAKGLVEYEKYKELQLTNKGWNESLQILRRHRIWETFLYKVLGMNMTEIHTEAEMLEHQTSDNLLQKLDAYLGHPEFDPHGEPIPDKKGKLPKKTGQFSVFESKPGKYRITRIISGDRTIDQYFKSIGVVIGMIISLKEFIPSLSSIEIEINNNAFVLHENLYKKIYLTKID